jgi:16S rRNA (uracil1498-N3)-methyltransferase
MQLFHTTNLQSNLAYFDEEETRHLQVLRKHIGDMLHFTDGLGNLYESEIIEIGKRQVITSVTKTTMEYKKRPYYLHIAIAPPKNIDRLEWFLEKATEIGIDEITPLLCHRSERARLRLDRLTGILTSAMKQSLQAKLPKLNELTDFSTFFKYNNSDISGQKYIAHCDYDNPKMIRDTYIKGTASCILIGPEGDFTDDEVKKALAQGFEGISLGANRLRTETAALVSVNQMAFLNQ